MRQGQEGLGWGPAQGGGQPILVDVDKGRGTCFPNSLEALSVCTYEKNFSTPRTKETESVKRSRWGSKSHHVVLWSLALAKDRGHCGGEDTQDSP